MNFVKPYKKEDILKITRHRNLEEKLGEFVGYCGEDWHSNLAKSPAKFVVIGIAEDIGVRANLGRAGASTAFRPALESFLNQQNNVFLDPSSIFILGEVLVDDLMEETKNLDQKSAEDLQKLRSVVGKLDSRVSEVMQLIISFNKTPIIIGGGHNNAFGNIKGASLAIKNKINVINCDPHPDFRPLEGRHSGNGFSYAYEEGYLKRYAVLGMHEQYNNNYSLEQFRKHPADLFYIPFDSIFVREQVEFKTALNQCIGFVKDLPCGIELDLDSITNIPSSAKTSSGINVFQARQYVYQCASRLEVLYFHIAEGAPVLSHIKADNKTGKLISYLITDFIKGAR